MYPKPIGQISHARRALISLIETRRFTGTLRAWGVSKSMIMAAYETALGRREPSFGVIFALREYISPELWFYDESEEPRNPIKTKQKDDKKNKKTALIRKKILQEPTIAIGILTEIMEKRELSSFAANHTVKYHDLWGICNKRQKSDGRYGFHQRPPLRVIKALREVIHPALWYLFPDELV